MQLSSPGVAVVAGLALGCLLLGGCASGTDSGTGSGTGGDGQSPTTTTPPVPSTSSPAPPATATATASRTSSPASSPSTASVAGCTSADVRITLRPGDAAAGSVYSRLRMTNTSDAACRTSGFGGVSYVARRGGAQVGAAADRVQRDQVRTLTVRPGASVQATLRETNPDDYPRGRCRPTRVAGLRVYPPDETRSVFVPHATRGCATTSVHLLELAPYARLG